MIRIDHQDGVQRRGRKARVAALAEHRLHVQQSLGRHSARNRREHLRLHVLGVDRAIGPDAPRQANREPAGAGADVGNDRCLGDAEVSMI